MFTVVTLADTNRTRLFWLALPCQNSLSVPASRLHTHATCLLSNGPYPTATAFSSCSLFGHGSSDTASDVFLCRAKKALIASLSSKNNVNAFPVSTTVSSTSTSTLLDEGAPLHPSFSSFRASNRALINPFLGFIFFLFFASKARNNLYAQPTRFLCKKSRTSITPVFLFFFSLSDHIFHVFHARARCSAQPDVHRV